METIGDALHGSWTGYKAYDDAVERYGRVNALAFVIVHGTKVAMGMDVWDCDGYADRPWPKFTGPGYMVGRAMA
jgi:hypothetical protein